MIVSVVIAAAASMPQLSATPFPAVVGQPVVVTVGEAGNRLRDVEVRVELPDRVVEVVGRTGADGQLEFVPRLEGRHLFAADLAGVRNVTPLEVLPPRRRWLLGVVTVPLGLALLWAQLRPRRQPSTRST